jgi:hypothetical protein
MKSLSPAEVAHTEGAWTQLTASTARDCFGIWLSAGRSWRGEAHLLEVSLQAPAFRTWAQLRGHLVQSQPGLPLPHDPKGIPLYHARTGLVPRGEQPAIDATPPPSVGSPRGGG